MIIVKWHLLIWHKRKLCALTNGPPAQSTQTGQWLSNLFDANCSAAQVYVLHPWQFIFAPSCRRRSVLQVFLSSESQEGYFRKKLRITHVPERNLTEARIEPKAEFDRMFRSSEVWIRSVDWTHDMIIVKWHLLIWHKRKLCALTNRPPAQSTQTGQWLSKLLDANCSAAQFYVLHPLAIHLRSKLKATIGFAGISFLWETRRMFWKIFCVSDDNKCYGEGMS